jgi:hypothetical protein
MALLSEMSTASVMYWVMVAWCISVFEIVLSSVKTAVE